MPLLYGPRFNSRINDHDVEEPSVTAFTNRRYFRGHRPSRIEVCSWCSSNAECLGGVHLVFQCG
jgi:hypothetical protein